MATTMMMAEEYKKKKKKSERKGREILPNDHDILYLKASLVCVHISKGKA